MKYRVLVGIIGASMLATALSGCEKANVEETTENQTIEIADLEVLNETEPASETVAEQETLSLELDLGNEVGNTKKAGASETLPESESLNESETLPESETSAELQTEEEEETLKKKDYRTKKPGEPETMTEKKAESETQKQTVKETESETETEEVRETETESQTEVQTEIGVVVINDRVNVRMEPSTESEIAALLTCGMKVVRAESDGEWSKISYESENGLAEGYVKDEFLIPFEALYLASESVYVRAEATTESDKIGGLDEKQNVILEESLDNGWSKIRFMDESEVKTAFVKSEFLVQADASSISGVLEEVVERFFAERTEQQSAENETELGSEAESERETESETAAETELESTTELESAAEESLTLPSGEKGQFELTKMLFPEVQSVGIIYSTENKNSEKQLASYEKLAAEYGMSVTSSEIEQEIDIDLAASELVGSVDCIFCIDDEMVTPLVQTIRAYADEVEIPVIGISKSHVEQGCVAAYLEDGLHLNTEEAGKLGLDVSGMSFGKITEH